ncbi:MAG: sugar transferase [Thermoanaerobaculaceae bacterium]
MTTTTGWYRRWGKRGLDLALTVGFAPLWLPLLGLLAAAVRVVLGRPAFFRQTRPGLHGQPFTLLKLRTMSDKADADGKLLGDELRLGRFGRALRATSLDELPELINVLKGEMSLVGPRPLLMHYLPLYNRRQARRHEVRPGITGWAQVNGRNATTWEQRLEDDVWYVENARLFIDFKIAALTLWKVVMREGISADGHATMPQFQGTKSDG